MTALTKHDNRNEVASAPQAYTAEVRVVMELLNRADLPMDRAEALLSRLDMIRERDEAAAYNEAMRQVKANLPVVGRSTANSHTKKNYADLADIAAVCDPVIAAHGFSTEYWPFNSEKPDHLGIGCTVSHANGHKREYKADVPLDGAGAKGNANKPAIHAWKSTMTYGRRALKEAIFDIATTDDDGNGAMPQHVEVEFITDEQLADLRAEMKKTGTEESKFVAYLKEPTLGALTVQKFHQAMAALKAKAEAMGVK